MPIFKSIHFIFNSFLVYFFTHYLFYKTLIKFCFLPQFLLIFFLFFSACQTKNNQKSLPISFYYWQTTLKKDVLSKEYFEHNFQNNFQQKNQNINKNTNKNSFFVRLFDVDYNPESKSAEPVAILKGLEFLPKNQNIVPVVFITNQTMHALNKQDVEILANRIWKKVSFLLKDIDFQLFQVDCDWNESTKANYFHFLNILQKNIEKNEKMNEKINQKSKKEISVTIRLHQIKFYKKTGIPPVKFGTLMAYNMGNVREMNEENSILDTKILTSYLSNLPNYPLKLDLALPLFSWIVVQRQGKVVKLLPQEDFDLKPHLFLKENFYQVTESQYQNEYYFYKNDILKLETTTKENLAHAVEILQQYKPKKGFESIIFYHFEKNILSKFDAEFLKQVASKF